MRALVHNPYWDTVGGGERYTATFIRLLLDNCWQADIDWPKDISGSIRQRFGLDITGSSLVAKPDLSKYDLVFWLSDGSLPLSLSKKTLIHFQFPFHGIHGKSISNIIKSRFYTFIVNSRFTKSYIDREFSVNSTVIYPPIDTSKFIPGKKIPQILYVGRFSQLTQHKNQDLLIRSFSKLSPRFPDWKLVIAGGIDVGTEPDFLQKLKDISKSLPVTILTNPSFTQLQKLYSESSVFWSASGYSDQNHPDPLNVEHFGISVVEAMSAGCVPVVSDFGGHSEIVTSGSDGYLWSDPDELLSFTSKIISDPESVRRLSKQAVKKSKIFDVSKFRESFSEFIKI